MTDYFSGCKTEREYKLRYHTLAKKHHPDAGGDIKVMQEINRVYDDIKKNGWKNHTGYKVNQDFGDAFRYSWGRGFTSTGFNQKWDWESIFKQQKKEQQEYEATRIKKRQEEELKREYAKRRKEQARMQALQEFSEILTRMDERTIKDLALNYYMKCWDMDNKKKSF